jgi:tetratricopeptide (TPR) repeat protein
MDNELQMQLPSPELLEKLSLGYQNFLANLLWIKTIAYFGGKIENADYNYLQRLLSAINQVNPNAEHAYYLAASAIPWNTNSTQLSRPIVERAIRQFPNDWHWPYFRGFNAYWFDHDFKEAGRMFSQAALIDGAPQIVTNLALRMRAESGQLDTALLFLQRLIQDKRDNNLNKQLLKQRNLLLTEKTLQRIDNWLRTLDHRFNDARDLQQLRKKGYTIPLTLADGGEIIVNADGTIISNVSNKRFKVFVPPKRSKLNLENNQ